MEQLEITPVTKQMCIRDRAYMIYQCMFAIITPALITGAIAERMSFRGFLMFTVLWSILIYNPLAHWVWGVGGWLQDVYKRQGFLQYLCASSARTTIAAADPSDTPEQSMMPRGSAIFGEFLIVSIETSFWNCALGFFAPFL